MTYHVIKFDQGEQLIVETTMSEEEFKTFLMGYKKYFDEMIESNEIPMSIFEWAEVMTEEVVRELEITWHDFNDLTE